MSTDAWGNKGMTIDDVVNDVSTNEFVLDSTFIAAVAFRKEATYPVLGFMVWVLLGQVSHPGQDLWVTFWDEQMRSFVEFDAEFFRHFPPTGVRVSLRKEASGHYISYNITDLTVMNS